MEFLKIKTTFLTKFYPKKYIFIGIILLSILQFRCALFQRSSESGYGESKPITPKEVVMDSELRRSAYELGIDPSMALTQDQLQKIHDRQRVRDLEKNLSSKKEKEQYSKILPWLTSDQEKISFLSIPSLEGRQGWINNKNIWERAQRPTKEFKDVIENQDIALGMPQELVKKSWGEPQSVEVSGNPIYKNEKWKYSQFHSSQDGFKKQIRIVYFEGGRVVGWETE